VCATVRPPLFCHDRSRGRFVRQNGREAEGAKTLTVAAVTSGVIAMPAHAQMGGKRRQGDEKKDRAAGKENR